MWEDGSAGEDTTIGELKTRKAEIQSLELRLRYHAGHRRAFGKREVRRPKKRADEQEEDAAER